MIRCGQLEQSSDALPLSGIPGNDPHKMEFFLFGWDGALNAVSRKPSDIDVPSNHPGIPNDGIRKGFLSEVYLVGNRLSKRAEGIHAGDHGTGWKGPCPL